MMVGFIFGTQRAFSEEHHNLFFGTNEAFSDQSGAHMENRKSKKRYGIQVVDGMSSASLS